MCDVFAMIMWICEKNVALCVCGELLHALNAEKCKLSWYRRLVMNFCAHHSLLSSHPNHPRVARALANYHEYGRWAFNILISFLLLARKINKKSDRSMFHRASMIIIWFIILYMCDDSFKRSLFALNSVHLKLFSPESNH